ncbi:hypothetical protein C4572_03935 [Candidatus Parcubacteria bacterium]|nr:MAG: hypothetical protein C4572_03935 [Candidatus Parcubacteria bacterium]
MGGKMKEIFKWLSVWLPNLFKKTDPVEKETSVGLEVTETAKKRKIRFIFCRRIRPSPLKLMSGARSTDTG